MQSLLARVSLPAIRANAECFRRETSRPLFAVVKDDGYGHGAVEVALALHGVASCFAVATVEEGAELRVAGISEDILVLTPPLCEEECARLIFYDLVGCLSSEAVLSLMRRGMERAGMPPRVHLAVNTGMNRYGFRPNAARRAARQAREMGIRLEGVFSHYFEASLPDVRGEQESAFATAAAGVKEFFPDAVAHLSATGGVLYGGKCMDAVRVGLGLYGYLPEPILPLRRAMKLYATVSHRCRQFGRGAGYALSNRPLKALHTIRLGYGDGFFREGLEFREGRGAVGKLCMDAAVCEGDAPFGRRKLVVDDFEVYAEAHGTSVYEALVRLGARAEREYIR